MKKFVSLLLASLLTVLLVIPVSAATAVGFYLDSPNRVGDVITVAPGESVSIQVKVKSAVSLMAAQLAIPYNNSMFSVETDEFSGDALELSLRSQCVKAAVSGVAADISGTVVTEVIFTPKEGLTSGEIILNTAMLKAYSSSGEALPVYGEYVTLRIGAVPVAGHEHDYGTEWVSDENQHWHECSNADGNCTEVRTKVYDHVADGGVVTVTPTYDDPGEKVYTCWVCGYVMRTDVLPPVVRPHEHKYSESWSHDATHHWHECSNEDGQCEETKIDVAVHVSDGGKVVVSPTYSSTGTKAYSCVTCGEVMRLDTIPALVSTNPGYPSRPSNPSTPTVPDDIIIDNPDIPLDEAPLPFIDVFETDWFIDNVRDLYWRGLMLGVADNLFGPYITTNRAMIATILYRLHDSPEVEYKGVFTDVPDGTWYSDAVEWAAANGVVMGYGDGRFGPNDAITREQLCAMLYRNMGSDTSKAGDMSKFVDSEDVSDWAYDAVSWSVGVGLVIGTDKSELLPVKLANRAEVSAVISRYCTLVDEAAG